MSGADAFPDVSRPIGMGASLGCFEVLRGTMVVSRQVSSYLCHGCPRGLPMRFPFFPLWLQPGHVQFGSHSISGRFLNLQSDSRLCVRIPLACFSLQPWHAKTCRWNKFVLNTRPSSGESVTEAATVPLANMVRLPSTIKSTMPMSTFCSNPVGH